MRDEDISKAEKIFNALKEKIESGEISDEELTKIRNTVEERLIKLTRYEIPLERIPRGVFLCLKNSDRLRKDAVLLAENTRYQSAIAFMILSIEEFGKALTLTQYFVNNQPIQNDEGYGIFNKHLNKIQTFFTYLSSIDGYQIASRTNQFINMVDEIDDDQFYKLRMMYVNYESPIRQSKYWNNKDGWFDPLYIWQLAFVGDHDVMHSLHTKYDELKNDLEFGILKFRQSESYKKILQSLPPPPLDPISVSTFLGDHFLIESIQLSTETGSSSIKVILQPRQSQSFVNNIPLDHMKEKLQEHFKIQNVIVELIPKNI